MRDAVALPNREPEDPDRVDPQVVPLDDVILQFEVESQESDGAEVSPSKGAEPARIAAFPIDAKLTAVTRPVAVPVEPTPPKSRNWRNAILALLATVVLTQGALMAYWMMSSGGLATVIRATGNVTITSEPPGSTVAIDGSASGQTPLTMALNSGAHTISVGTGVQARSQDVNVTRGGNSSIHVQLPSAVAAPFAWRHRMAPA